MKYRGANTALMGRKNYEVDELRLNPVPTVFGGELRLFGDGLPRSDLGVTTLATGMLGLQYTRRA